MINYKIYFVPKGTEHYTNTSWLDRDGRWVAEAFDDFEGNLIIEDTSAHSPKEALEKLEALLAFGK